MGAGNRVHPQPWTTQSNEQGPGLIQGGPSGAARDGAGDTDAVSLRSVQEMRLETGLETDKPTTQLRKKRSGPG